MLALRVNSGTGERLLLQPYEYEGKDKDRGSAHVKLLDVPINHGRASRRVRYPIGYWPKAQSAQTKKPPEGGLLQSELVPADWGS
jgi:hypothetical protein